RTSEFLHRPRRKALYNKNRKRTIVKMRTNVSITSRLYSNSHGVAIPESATITPTEVRPEIRFARSPSSKIEINTSVAAKMRADKTLGDINRYRRARAYGCPALIYCDQPCV